MFQKNKYGLALFLILILGFILRAWGIGFGLPYVQNLDESSVIYTALNMAGNLGKPNVYVHGTIIPGLVGIFSGIYFLTGKAMGDFSNLDDFLVSIIKDPTPLVLFGRGLNLVFSLVSIGLIYVAGKKIFNRRVGIFASLFIAVSVLQVKESHYLKPDVLAGLLSLVVLYLSYLISQRGNFRDYLVAGIGVGLAIAVKFTLIFLLPLILLAHLLGKRNNKGLLIFLSSTTVSFFAVSPYAFLDFRSFLSDFLRLKGYLALSRGYEHSPLWYYLFEYLKEGLGIWVWTLAIIGFLISCLNLKRIQYALLLFFPVIFLITTNFWSKEHSQRYILPVVPYFVLLAGVAVDWIIKKIQNKAVLMLFLMIIIWQPLARSIKLDWLITQVHTGIQATNWIKKNIPPDSKIAVEGTLRPSYLPAHGPYLRLSVQSSSPKAGNFQRDILRALSAKNGYQILATPNLAFRYDPELGYWDLRDYEEFSSADYYINEKVEYIVSNSWAQNGNYLWSEAFGKSLNKKYQVIAEFRPTTGFRWEPHQVRLDYQALDRINLFTKGQVFGPLIKVYQKRDDS